MKTKRYQVDVYGYDAVVFEAESRDQARYQAFKAFRAAYPVSFREFLARGVRVQVCP